MRIKSRLAFILLCLGLTLFSTAQAQEVEISLDRNEIARGETVTLTIRIYDQRQGMQLDLTPLTSQFDVLGTRTSSQIRSVNGAVEAWTDYIVTLFPLEEGELIIPELDINGTTTAPIQVTVTNEGPRSNQSNEELYLEIETNKESVYVQEQLLFTVRLYYTINGIRNPQFTELEMEDSVIQLIGSPNQYEKLIDGERYGVYEKRYVIFPQRSGPLEVPDILFRGEVTDGSSNFVFRNLNTRRVTAFIEGITIDVLERPVAIQGNDFWLPVSNLALEESWSTDINNLKVGDSVVRTVTMTADGLDGAVLPPFGPEEIEGLNLYPDPAEIERTFVEGAIVGTRIETTSIVPIASGNVLIPEISIPWWNINTNQQEVTIIPTTRLVIATITGEIPAEQTVASSENLEELLSQLPIVDQDMIDEQAEAEFIEVKASWLNYTIATAFIIVMFSIYKLVIADNKREINEYLQRLKTQLAANYNPNNNERVAYKQLVGACGSNDLTTIRKTLITWCDHHIDSRYVISMEDILQQSESPALHEHVRNIQTALFQINDNQASSSTFDAKHLLQLISQLRKSKLRVQKKQLQEDQYSLPPLYKT
ncbi:MAG: BatD family protein [Gammaproteobacteria bacterium]|nr:BatD family protein [Gammaproteobacteria bacterium]